MAGLARDIAGRRYALAISEIAREQSSFARWAAVVDSLAALTGEPRFVNALHSDGMTDEKLQSIVRQVMPDIAPVEMNLFRLLYRKNRLALGPSIASYFHELWDQEQGVARAIVRTAVELADQTGDRTLEQVSRQTCKTSGMKTEGEPSMPCRAVHVRCREIDYPEEVPLMEAWLQTLIGEGVFRG